MGKQTDLEVVGKGDLRRAVAVDVARPKGKKLHFVEPTLVQARHLGDGLGYLKVAMFPGMVGVEVANEISRAVEELGKIDSLIIDLRGNTGGEIGALRIMSLLTPGRIPVGFALPRSRVTPNLDSEKQQFRPLRQYSRFQEGPLVVGIAVCSSNADQEANRPTDGRIGR
jgi:C-terminal processing protease CtpA/Prc